MYTYVGHHGNTTGIGNRYNGKKLQRSASCPEVFPSETKVYETKKTHKKNSVNTYQ